MVIHFTASEKGKIGFCSVIDGRDDYYDKNEAYDDSTLLFTVSDGIPYAAAVSVTSKGGTACTDANRIIVDGADEATVTLACQTSYRTADYVKKAIGQAKTALRKDYFSKLRSRHINDYSSLYNRCSIILSDNSNGNAELPTNERLQKIRDGKSDNKLVEM